MPRQQSHLSSVAKSGCAGMCSLSFGALAIVFLLPACILLAISGSGDIEDDPYSQDDNFKKSQEMHNLSFRVAGSLLLVASLILIVITICMCSYVCKKLSTATTDQAGHLGEIVVGGAAPPPAGYHTQTAGGATSCPIGARPGMWYPRSVDTTATASDPDPAPPYPGLNIPPSSPPGVEPPTPPPTYDDFINKGPNLFNKKY